MRRDSPCEGIPKLVTREKKVSTFHDLGKELDEKKLTGPNHGGKGGAKMPTVIMDDHG